MRLQTMQLCALRRQRLCALVAESALELAFQVLELAPLRRSAALIELQPLQNIAAKLEAKIRVVGRSSVDLRTRLIEDWMAFCRSSSERVAI